MAEYTTGHCQNHKQPGGCQLHNLQCGWPNCDRRPVQPHPPSGASVSERARSASLKEIVPAEKRNYLDDNGNPRSIEDEAYAHGWNACRAATIRTLEQALTQQRGDGEAVDRDAWAEALELPEGYTVEEFLPGGWHYAWTRADGERMVSGTTWNHPALAAIAAWQYAPATTPSDAGGDTPPNPGDARLPDDAGNDPRVDDDSYRAAITACRSQLGAQRPYDDEPEEQWMWDKLTKLLSLLDGKGAA